MISSCLSDDEGEYHNAVKEMAETVSSLFKLFATDGDTIEDAAIARGTPPPAAADHKVDADEVDADEVDAGVPSRASSASTDGHGQEQAPVAAPARVLQKEGNDEIVQSSADIPHCGSSSSPPLVEKTDTPSSRCRRKAIISAGVSFGVIVLIVVGAVLGTRGKTSSNGTSLEENLTSPSLKPTAGSNNKMSSEPQMEILTSTMQNNNPATGASPRLFNTFSFYVMGDAPYNKNQQEIVQDQIVELSADVTNDDMFLIHVGDALSSNSGCPSSDYAFMRNLLINKLPRLPSLIIPGDNDWRDCKDRKDAWKLWKKHFMALEKNWNQTMKAFLPSVVRQPIREENFAFRIRGVLFIGVHILGGANDGGASRRQDDNEAWVDEQVQRHSDSMQNGRIRAVIVFGHAMNAPRLRLLEHLRTELSPFGLPVIYFKGDKHTFEVCDSFLGVTWANFTMVQVEQGANAPPIKVTIRGTTPSSLQQPFEKATSSETMLSDFIKLDQRGGRYSWAKERGMNACGAESRQQVDADST
mmetsp:Transcript_34334/g.75534  ORF Transcript_34334/g.75534 Transcript_34334/m.75534 type:complete len:528 (-) Transcript_34334:76-1659(-)